jgi:hypothetical protein
MQLLEFVEACSALLELIKIYLCDSEVLQLTAHKLGRLDLLVGQNVYSFLFCKGFLKSRLEAVLFLIPLIPFVEDIIS